jgi:endonuclease/exonuclease/phosphatase family metal-dependent hydrolase
VPFPSVLVRCIGVLAFLAAGVVAPGEALADCGAVVHACPETKDVASAVARVTKQLVSCARKGLDPCDLTSALVKITDPSCREALECGARDLIAAGGDGYSTSCTKGLVGAGRKLMQKAVTHRVKGRPERVEDEHAKCELRAARRCVVPFAPPLGGACAGTTTPAGAATCVCAEARSLQDELVAKPPLAAGMATYVVGEHVTVDVVGAPGTGADWVGIYEANEKSNDDSIYWQYLQGGQVPEPGGPTSASLLFLPMSLVPGTYHARLFFDDEYERRGTAYFHVTSETADPPPPPLGDLTLMSFNIWHSGTSGVGGLKAIAAAIAAVGADAVGLQEATAEATLELAEELRKLPGYEETTASGPAAIVTREEILQEYLPATTDAAAGVRLGLDGGREIRFFTAHLGYTPYGPYLASEGATEAEILAGESERTAQIEATFDELLDHPPFDPEMTTIIVGDFNTPSHLDWTAANAVQNFGYVFAWPVTTRLESGGFFDAFRSVHPDPVAVRGLTWTAGPFATDEIHDRIDMIHIRPAAGGETVTVHQSYTMGEVPWVSDHRAVAASVTFGP